MDKTVLRNLLIGLAVVLVSSAVAFAGIFLALDQSQRPGAPQVGSGPSTPSTTTSPALPATSSAAASIPPGGYAIESTAPPGIDASIAAEASQQPVYVQALPRVAYVKGGNLYVSDEDGKHQQLIVPMKKGGVYHLSLDRRHIAFAIPQDKSPRLMLYVAPVGGSAKYFTDLATGGDFSWSPDGKWIAGDLVQLAGNQVKKREIGTVHVAGSGGESRFGFEGREPAFSPDGKQVAFLRPLNGLEELWIAGSLGEHPAPVAPGKDVMSVAWLDQSTLVAVQKGPGPTDQLIRVRTDGSQLKVLATNGSDQLRSMHEVLSGGEDSRIAYDIVGDDGYSRIVIAGPDGQGKTLIPGDRDVYPLAWGLDGGRLFYIEGNASQGEPTALASVNVDGKGKRFIVAGGGL